MQPNAQPKWRMKKEKINMSSTEAFAKRYINIENWETNEIVDAMFEGQLAAVSAALQSRQALIGAINASSKKLAKGGRILYLGAGTSGRLAALDAAELPPTFNWPYERAIALMAGGEVAYFKAVEGAEDCHLAGVEALKSVTISSDDVVIGLAASGNTPYVVAALAHAQSVGALTIAIGNNPQGLIKDVANYSLIADTGAEILAGSTRMKAGTAQKVILTCLSTGIFIKLGYVFRGRMVEMQPTNIKLQHRAVKMVAELTGASEMLAETTLEKANSSIKVAVVMLLKQVNLADASNLLLNAEGRLDKALADA